MISAHAMFLVWLDHGCFVAFMYAHCANMWFVAENELNGNQIWSLNWKRNQFEIAQKYRCNAKCCLYACNLFGIVTQTTIIDQPFSHNTFELNTQSNSNNNHHISINCNVYSVQMWTMSSNSQLIVVYVVHIHTYNLINQCISLFALEMNTLSVIFIGWHRYMEEQHQ